MSKRELIGKVTDDSGKTPEVTELWLSAPGVATAKTTTENDGSLAVPGRAAVSAAAGWTFMLAMIGALALVASLYLKLHAFDPAKIEEQDSSSTANTRS